MYSQSSRTSRSKAPSGSVQIKVSNERLQLFFTYAGKRKYLSLGLWDSPANWKVAEAKAKLIEADIIYGEADIIYGRFDPTLEKYRVRTSLSAPTPTVAPIAPVPTLAELWEQYTQYRSTQISASTLVRDYGKVA